MKKVFITTIPTVATLVLGACPVCERAKAKIAFGQLSHGALPTSKWEYVAVWIVVLMVLLTLVYSVKWLIHPKEKNQNHIKYSILNFE